MNQPFSPEALEELINQIKIAKPTQDPLCCYVGVWKSELLSHPERFRIDNNELVYLGYEVGIYGNQQEKEEFLTLVDKIIKGE